MKRLSLRSQLLLGLLVPVAAILFGLILRAETIAGRALESALGERLTAVAGAAAASTSPYVLVLGVGDDATRTKRNGLLKLEELRAATGVARILLIRADDTVLLDTEEVLPIGARYHRAELDRSALDPVRSGATASSILFRGPEGRPYKTGYAPVGAADGIEAYVAVVAPASYTDALFALRRRLGLLGLAGLSAIALLTAAVAALITRPLARLSVAATRIGSGRLDTEIPVSGPRESVVLGQTMQSMTESLGARNEQMQMMLAGIAHEVRNPLGGIELFGGLLKEDLQGDPRQEHVDKILKELGVLSRVVSDFLDFARRQPHSPAQTDLRELFAEVAALVEPSLAGATLEGADLAVETAWVDREAVQRALLNLVRNSAQAAGEEGKIAWSARARGDELELTVEDDGPGIPEASKQHVLEPFYTTKQKGTGLGLALVRQTALAHGGHLRVEKSEMGGARVVIVLPEAARIPLPSKADA